MNARALRGYSIEIAATGYAYPGDVVHNDEYFARSRFPIADPEALVRRSRMRTRYWCTERESSWTLARAAALGALAADPALLEVIDVVVAASGTTMPVLHPPEADRPGHGDLAPLVVRDVLRTDRLGLDLKACYCTGFLRALEVVDGLLGNPCHRAALIVCAEQASRLAVAETNRSGFCFIAGDAAGAVVVRRVAVGGTGLLDYTGATHAGALDLAGIGADGRSMIMKGDEASRMAIGVMLDRARELLRRNGLSVDEVDWFVPLQTHYEVVEQLREDLGFPRDKLLWTGDVTGFSGSASIPACLAVHVEKGVVRRGDLVLSVAAGAGLNSAGALYRY